MPQIEPTQYVVGGISAGAFAFIMRLVYRFQRSVTDVAFDRIDKLEADLNAERERCDRLAAEVHETSRKVWALEYELAAIKRSNEGDGK